MPEIAVNTSFDCCGLHEINGISEYRDDNEDVLFALLTTDEGGEFDPKTDTFKELRSLDTEKLLSGSHVVFTQASKTRVKSGYGYNLANLIEKEKLGTVVAGDPSRNPNSGNYVHPFIWTPDKKGIRAWAKRNNVRT